MQSRNTEACFARSKDPGPRIADFELGEEVGGRGSSVSKVKPKHNPALLYDVTIERFVLKRRAQIHGDFVAGRPLLLQVTRPSCPVQAPGPGRSAERLSQDFRPRP